MAYSFSRSSMDSVNKTKKKQRKEKKQAARVNSGQLEQLDSLPWINSASGNDDSFSFFIGSNELEGGFFSLEEIDEKDYGLEIPKLERKHQEENLEGKTKSKKRKRQKGDETVGGIAQVEKEQDRGGDEVQKEVKRKTKKRNKDKNNNLLPNGAAEEDTDLLAVANDEVLEKEGDKVEDEVQKEVERKTMMRNKEKSNNILPNDAAEEDADLIAGTNGDNDFEDNSVDGSDYHAWSSLRLHPLLMKSIRRLKFKEPTLIQKTCIPAAAHQGKDVIGAAETGSGKTLAFGLPILQRLLEEREKADKLIAETGEADERIVSKGYLRALIITPTRELALQVTDHLKEAAKGTNIRVVPVVGGMSSEKQARVLKSRPEVVVGTPGRLWELMSGGAIHLVELHSLSFFVLDEADRMVENGHFRELQSIIDMLPVKSNQSEGQPQNAESCLTVSNTPRKKRQTFVFSATIALSRDFRKKLKRESLKSKLSEGLNSIETLSERAGIRENAAIIDLTNASILAHKLEESFIECREEDKDAYLYYILSVHGQGRTIIFCTSVAALRHSSSLLRILGVTVWTLHAQMQQRARLKAIDHFRTTEHGILVATDVAARGIDIPGIRTVIHYQLPHSAEVYVHRSGRTARAFSDGCSIALISPNETSKFAALCRSFAKESFQLFPTEASYMPEVMKRLSLARQIDKILRKVLQEKAKKSWFERNAESVELVLDHNDSEEERVNVYKQKKITLVQLKKLQQELNTLLSRPLQPNTFSNRFLAGAGVSPQLQHQFEELARVKLGAPHNLGENKRRKLVVIGQDCVEPLKALRSAGQAACMDLKEIAEKKRNVENFRRKRKEEKKRLRDRRRKQKKKLQEA